ncbi:hypothetical protein L7F22_069368 [Adiantum nelumboides]|nr:hypothetical protein [Adiantum nelumboides]
MDVHEVKEATDFDHAEGGDIAKEVSPVVDVDCEEDNVRTNEEQGLGYESARGDDGTPQNIVVAEKDEENKIEDEGDMSQATQQVLPTIDEETPFHKGDAMSTQEVVEHESDFVAQKPSNDTNKESENMLSTIEETQIHEGNTRNSEEKMVVVENQSDVQTSPKSLDDMIIKDTYSMPLRDEEVEGSEKKDEANEEHQGALATTEVQGKVDKGTGKATRNANKAQSIQERVQGTEGEAEQDAEVEIVGGYNCEEYDPKVEVPIEKEGVLAKDNLENGDQAKYYLSSIKDNEVSARDTNPSILQTIKMMQRERKRSMTDGAVRKPIQDVEGQTKTSKDQVEKETGDNCNMESGRKDDDASYACGAVGACEDMEIIIGKFEQPHKNGDASMDASGDASCGGGASGDMGIIIEKVEPPQENGDAFVDVGEDASCGGGAIGVGEDMEIIIEKFNPPQENGDPSLDANGDASCTGGAGDVGYVRHNDGMMSQPWEDGGDAGYVRNNNGTVSHP